MPNLPDDPFNFVHPATGCSKCPQLVTGRHTIVWGSGPAQSEIMFIGEAPGQREDMEGKPFIGPAGNLLSELCLESGIKRTDVHIANRIMCRPPGNRDPETEELENCEPWLIEHVRSVNPKLIVLFGRTAIGWYFDKTTVRDTQGLMYISRCDWCGQFAHRGHSNRAAADGKWTEHAWGIDRTAACPGAMVRRLVAAIYHPASVLGGRSPDNRPHIVHQLRRAVSELAYAKENALV